MASPRKGIRRGRIPKTDLWKPGGFMDLRRGGVRPRRPTPLPPQVPPVRFRKPKSV